MLCTQLVDGTRKEQYGFLTSKLPISHISDITTISEPTISVSTISTTNEKSTFSSLIIIIGKLSE